MQFPISLLNRLKGLPDFSTELFIDAHEKSPPVSLRINPKKNISDHHLNEKVLWCSTGFYLNQRPVFTLDPFLHAGCFYVQEASSMFLSHLLKNVIDLNKQIKVLDLCAAPGGKSTLISSLINQESLLVSNEVIRTRVQILKENVVKWGDANTIITNNDPADFSKLKNYFDVIIVDAPCSGSGLFRKEKHAIETWSIENVLHCSKRQHRIIEDILPALKENGILIYSTCSYSEEENEEIVQKMMQQGCDVLDIEISHEWNIVKNDFGFRFYPDKIKGEGFFISVLKKNSAHSEESLEQNYQNEKSIGENVNFDLSNFILQFQDFEIYVNKNFVTAYSKNLFLEIQYLCSVLKVIKSGVHCGEIKGKDFIPSQELAMSEIMHPDFNAIEVDLENALQYLRKNNFTYSINKSIEKGFYLVQYKKINLGWVKILENRINNYYPVDWRIKNL